MKIVCLIAISLLPGFVFSQTTGAKDVWQPLKFFIGEWEGFGKGQPGNSTLARTYKFVLNGKYIQVVNKTTYVPQEKNPKGEIHEDLGIISYDRIRKHFIFRQFHVEGFVNQYLSGDIQENFKTIIFTTESIENIPDGWRARETYKIINDNEFSETFELAESGKEFEIYSENMFKRKK